MLTVDNLTRRYRRLVAVDGLTFTAAPGEITGLLGHNGCGKSTTMRILAGAMSATSGSYTFDGIVGGVDVVELKLRTGYIPDIGGIFPRLTGWEHLELCASLFRLDKATWPDRARGMLEALQISDAAGSLAGTYSHGMGRKLSTAVALLPQPDLLLADEPFDGVDADGVATVSRMLRERAAAGATVVLSTHLLGVADELCSRTWTMIRGAVRDSDPTGSGTGTGRPQPGPPQPGPPHAGGPPIDGVRP